MVDQARREQYSVHAVDGTGKHSSILQFRSAHDDGDSKGTSDGRTSGCPATGHTAVASTRTPRAADEGQTNYSRFQAVVATSAAVFKKMTMDDLVLKRCLGK